MKLRRALASPKLAAVLIAVLLLLALLSVIVPQSGTLGAAYVGEWRRTQPWLAVPALALGLDRVFASWPYWIVSLLLAVNLTACTLERVLRRRATSLSVGVAPADAVRLRFVGDAEEGAGALKAAMRGFETTVLVGGVVARSGRYGFLGSVIMHAGLVVLVAAGVATGLTRFEGQLLLTEGQALRDVPASYLKVDRTPALGHPYTSAEITLDRLEFDYTGHTVTDARAYMTVTDGGRTRRSVVRVNEPLRIGNKSFLLKDAGFAAALKLTDPSGREYPPSFVDLGKSAPDGSFDSVDVGGLHLDILTVGDLAGRGRNVAEKFALVQPAAIMTATVDGTSTSVASTVVRPGETVKAGGWRIDLLEIRRWNRFNARLDLGMYVAYLGFALALLGTAMRVFDPDRVVRAAFFPAEDGATEVALWGRARWGKALADEAVERAARAMGDERRDQGSTPERKQA